MSKQATMVEVVNGNGQKGLVASTSRAAKLYQKPPSAKADDDTETPTGNKPAENKPVKPTDEKKG